MLKTIFTLVRGAAFRAEEEFADRSALLILDQQIRDAAGGDRARQAGARGGDRAGRGGRKAPGDDVARIADLEERAVAALNGGSEELAAEAAEAIAVMEADRDSIREARATFAREIGAPEGDRAQVGQRLAELERGRRIASAAESVRRLKAGSGLAGPSGATALADAEATLAPPARTAGRGCRGRRTPSRRSTPSRTRASVADRLEAAGFGKRTRPTAASVLERLKQKTGASAPAA